LQFQVNEIKRQLSTANSELKVFISAKLASTPALASLNDPVYVQLAAYAIIGDPLLLLFLPVLLWLATCLAPTSKVMRCVGRLMVVRDNHREVLRAPTVD